MRIPLWTLLAVVTSTFAASPRNLQSTTPRYTKDVGDIGIVRLLSEYLGSVKTNSDAEISRKLNKKRIDFVVHKGNENHFKLRIGNKQKITTTTTPRITTKRIVKNSLKVVGNHKIIHPNPIKVIVEASKNQTNLGKKPDPIEKLKFQNGHYKNYTKFRIKPANKQSDIIPVVSTYSPEYLSTPPAYEDLLINPQISTYSPEFPIGSTTPEITQNEPPAALNSLSPDSNPFGVPISQVLIQSLPLSPESSNVDLKDGLPNDCPSFLITSNLYNPQRQGCSDLSVIINSQLSQANPLRRPEDGAEAAAAEDPIAAADPAAGAPAEAAEPAAGAPGAAAEPAAAAPAAAQPAAAQPSQGSQGGSQGGGLPMLPEFPELSLPDLKGLFDILGVLWNGLRGIFGFLANPYLYIVPIGISFALGFAAVLLKFKFWFLLPGLILYGFWNKDAGKPEVYDHKYPLKVVHHHNGWFYNENTKTYDNILEYMHPKRVPIDVGRMITGSVERYKKTQTQQNQTTIKQPTHNNYTDVLDVRTPPKIKQMMKNKAEKSEVSHPGVAEPVDEESIALEESLKKMNFYKLEQKSTTDSGLSTWILLSGQAISSTPKPIKNTNETKNITIANPNRVSKPVFKKRPIGTTVKPTIKTTGVSSTEKITATTTSTTESTISKTSPASSTTPEAVKVTKVKASVNNAISSLKLTNSTNNLKKEKVEKEKTQVSSTSTTTTTEKSTSSPISSSSSSISSSSISSSSTVSVANLKPELKDGDLELPSGSTPSTPKKTRRPSQKKKKDKNRRRRPAAEEKVDSNDKENKTKLAVKDKPISTQIYNYLAREVMPTVGVGLVGLVVTAGLASYFLYPFGSLRRSYEIDRRDKDNTYYYGHDFSSGVPEEEAIGKVIAGMPLYNNEYRPQNSKNSYASNSRFRQSDPGYYGPQATIEEVQLDPLKDYKNDNYLQESYHTNEVHKNEPITYSKDVISKSVEAGYTTGDRQYVVGNVPKEVVQEVTPAAVPEHGPRSLKLRKRKREASKIGLK